MCGCKKKSTNYTVNNASVIRAQSYGNTFICCLQIMHTTNSLWRGCVFSPLRPQAASPRLLKRSLTSTLRDVGRIYFDPYEYWKLKRKRHITYNFGLFRIYNYLLTCCLFLKYKETHYFLNKVLCAVSLALQQNICVWNKFTSRTCVTQDRKIRIFKMSDIFKSTSPLLLLFWLWEEEADCLHRDDKFRKQKKNEYK